MDDKLWRQFSGGWIAFVTGKDLLTFGNNSVANNTGSIRD